MSIRRALSAGAAVALAAAGTIAGPFMGRQHHMGRTRYAHGRRPRYSAYRPHQGEREIARRLAQAERNEQRQLERMEAERQNMNWLAIAAGTNRMSRRWKPIP